jgi:nitrous oxide reductase accessory protein NosL
MRKGLPFILLLVFATALPGLAYAEPMEIPEGSKCHICGMKVDPGSPYSAQTVENDTLLPFCDIGDMLHYYKKQEEKPTELYVRDTRSREWTGAQGAFYVKSDQFSTPMGWGIAAFSDKEEAEKFGEPMTFKEALDALE